MNQLSIQYTNDGIKRAIDHAGEVWKNQACEYFRQFLRGIPSDRKFTTEQVRMFANERGLPPPFDCRAWGAIPKIMVAEGLIKSSGEYTKVESPQSHQRPMIMWIKK